MQSGLCGCKINFVQFKMSLLCQQKHVILRSKAALVKRSGSADWMPKWWPGTLQREGQVGDGNVNLLLFWNAITFCELRNHGHFCGFCHFLTSLNSFRWMAGPQYFKKIVIQLSINQIMHYFFVRQKVDQRAGQLSLSHVGITKTELKIKPMSK